VAAGRWRCCNRSWGEHRMIHRKRDSWLFLLAMLVATGCVSQDVRDLSKTTSSNASIASSQLDRFVKASRETAEARIDSISRLAQANADANLKFNTYMESARSASILTGSADKSGYAATVVELLRLADIIEAEYEANKGVATSRRAELLLSQSQLKPSKEGLSSIAKELAELSEKRSTKEFARFLAGYYQDVQAAVDEAAEAAEQAAVENKQDASEAGTVAFPSDP
ncbi:MAG: hypothetical protein AAF709_09705, partial [Pseudomonadota bacterium]